MYFTSRCFATLSKRAEVKIATNQSRPMLLVSEFGELLNVKPMTKLLPADREARQDLREVIMIDDNTDTRTLEKKMNHHPKAYFLYNPYGHWQNAQSLYSSLKKSLTKKHYG